MVEEKPPKALFDGLQMYAYVIAVVGVITLIVYLLARLGVMPGLIDGPIARQEAEALTTLRRIAKAEASHKLRLKKYGNLNEIFEDGDNGLCEATSPERAIYGYYYLLTLSKNNWSCVARPGEWGTNGCRNFKIDQTGAIYYNLVHNSEFYKPLGRR